MVKLPSLRPNETVPRIVRVTAESYDHTRRVDVSGIGALSGARARTRRVKGGNVLRRQLRRILPGLPGWLPPAQTGVFFLLNRIVSYPLTQ